jgi:hypothetical protein
VYPENMTKILEKVFAIAIQVAVVIWEQILAWTYSNFLAWIQKDMIPMLEKTVDLAFIAVNKITYEIVNAVKKAWQEVKQVLLEMIVQFEHVTSSNAWKKKSTSTIFKKVEANRPIFIKREIEEDLDWDNLPPEIRESWLKGSQHDCKIDFMKIRENELEAMTMEQ